MYCCCNDGTNDYNLALTNSNDKYKCLSLAKLAGQLAVQVESGQKTLTTFGRKTLLEEQLLSSLSHSPPFSKI